MFPLSNPHSTTSPLRGSNTCLVLVDSDTFIISLNLRKQTRFPTLVEDVMDETASADGPEFQRHGEAALLAMTHVLVGLGHQQKKIQ